METFEDTSEDNNKVLFGIRSIVLKVRYFEGEKKLLQSFRGYEMRVSLTADVHGTLQRDCFFMLRSKQIISVCRVASVRPWDVGVDRLKPNPTLTDLHDWIINL